MVIVFLGSVGISNVPFSECAYRMISSTVGGDGGVFPFSLGVLQESRDVVAADMLRFLNTSQ